MNQFKTKYEYMKQFQTALDQAGPERTALTNYLHMQFKKLDLLIESISGRTFWQVFPEILGIDAKLTLLTEIIPFGDLSSEEIIRIVESEYQYHFKELCGYDLKENDNPSMFFQLV